MGRNKSRIPALCMLWAVMFFLALASLPAQASAPVTVRVKVVVSGPPATVLPAGDDSKHTVGIGQRTGEAVFSDGRKAKYSNVFFMDYYQGKYANSWGYTKMLFEDGSWIFFKWDSAFAGRDKAGIPTFAGTGELQKGTGKYQGIKGTAKFTNRNIPPDKAHPHGSSESSATITYSLP